MSALSSISQGNQQAAAYKAQANVDTINANNTSMAYAAKEQNLRRQQAQKLGEARAASAENGTLGTGSSLDVQEEDTTQANLDALTLRYEGQAQRTNYLNSAAQNRSNASGARKAGYIGALSSVLSGGMRYGAGGSGGGAYGGGSTMTSAGNINWFPTA